MRLTDYTDYALRTLIYVAVHPDELVTIQRIADAFDIPKNHLIKIVQQLGGDGFLHTVRGRAGGMVVFTTLADESGLVECVLLPEVAARHGAAMRGGIVLAEGRVESTLDAITLVVERATALTAATHEPAAGAA